MTTIRPALPTDAPACVHLRGLTRENAVSPVRLASLGITAQSWAHGIDTGQWIGWVAERGGDMVGYCFGDVATGEVLVLALLPAHEGQGLGRRLLAQVTTRLVDLGHSRLFLGCAADPAGRSHGFYRHLGWQSTGQVDAHGDEVLELRPPTGKSLTPDPEPLTTMPNLQGSCLCGAITFTLRQAPTGATACHCKSCRKQSGHFFASADVPKAALDIVGADRLTWFQSSAKVRRGFCAQCGAWLFWEPVARDWTSVALGAIDGATGLTLERHIFVADKGDYYEIADGLPQNPQ